MASWVMYVSVTCLQAVFSMSNRFHLRYLVPHDRSYPADWLDNARDVLNFVENYLPCGEHDASAAPPPTHLQRVPPPITRSRIQNGFRNRHLVGLGHSAGACVLCVTPIARIQRMSSDVWTVRMLLAFTQTSSFL
jgi:hypothetical protein